MVVTASDRKWFQRWFKKVLLVKIQQIRNATVLIEANDYGLLVDPFFCRRAHLPPFRMLTFPWRLNPLVDLPTPPEEILKRTTHALITHRHPDHLDRPALRALKRNRIPVLCSAPDAVPLRRRGLQVRSLQMQETVLLPGLAITPVAALHGPGIWGRLMGHVAGYLLRFEGHPSLYLAGDTILTPEVRMILEKERPEVSIIPAGGARFDVGPEIILGLESALEFARLSPGLVVANHMDALDHCRTTRLDLRRAVKERKMEEQVLIPEDGETLTF